MKLFNRLLILIALLSPAGVSAQNCTGDYTWQVNGLTTSFFGTVSSNVEYIVWDFGDGNYDYSGQQNVQHTYASPGIYTACIQYADSLQSCSDSTCHSVVIDSCYGDFTYTINGLTVSFSGTSSMPTANTVYVWNFGDSSTGNGQTPTHTFAQSGTYTVCFAYYDLSNGCADSVCMPVTVGNCVNVNASFAYYVNGMSVTVNNTSTGTYAGAYWNFGDNSNWYPATTNPYQYSYSNSGNYHITLGLGNGNLAYACDSTGADITVPSNSSSCNASFSYIDSMGYFFFINNSTPGSSGGYMWDFGDGNYSTLFNPSNHYQFPGTYLVCLIAYDSMQNFCDSSCQYINVTNVASVNDLSSTISHLQLAPNPASGTFTVSYYLEQPASVNISLYDVTGRFVKELSGKNESAGQQNNQFNTESLNSGTYILRVNAGGRVINTRLVVTQRP